MTRETRPTTVVTGAGGLAGTKPIEVLVARGHHVVAGRVRRAGGVSGSSMSSALNRPAAAPPVATSFDDVVVPHLHAAHRLARWLMRNEHDAEDAVQEASLRAFRYFRTFAGVNGRAWFLQIVRNTCYRRQARGLDAVTGPFDEEAHDTDSGSLDPEALLVQTDEIARIAQAMRSLPGRFRELLTLRELDGLSYRELADVLRMPMGSVMSGLSRARQAFRGAMHTEWQRSGPRRRRRRAWEAGTIAKEAIAKDVR